VATRRREEVISVINRFYMTLRKFLTWRKIGGAIFGGWEIREKILRPVVVNLLTASLIFLAAVIFKDRIYNYFAPKPETKDWPIYCVLEPEVNNGGFLTADLFVMNLTKQKYVTSNLERLANDLSPSEGKKLSPLIEVAMKDNLGGAIISEITADPDFNNEKGSASIVPIDQTRKHWQIQLGEIREGKILKFIIHTTEERPVSSRANFETLPVKISYAREP
jgi:hypothetical protein